MGHGGRRFLWRVMAYTLGVALLLAAVGRAWTGVPWGVIDWRWGWGIAALSAACLALTSLLFWMVTLGFDARPRVTLTRMGMLIGASTLLNYLPLRPGLVGRTAYLKVAHQLPVRQSVLIAAMVGGVSLAVLTLAGAAVAMWPGMGGWAGAALAVLAVSLMTGPVTRRMLGRTMRWPWLWAPVRFVEALAGAGRMWLAFRVVGHPIDMSAAMALAAADMLVSLLSLTPNGLGLGEWAVGWGAAILGVGNMPVAQAAKLVDRGVSVLVAAVAGGVSLAVLPRGWKQDVE